MKESATSRGVRTVIKFLAAHRMITRGEAVLVAVSGGPDSMVLLHILQSVVPEKNLALGVAHLNHGLRPGEAELEEALVHNASKSAGLPYFTEKADVPAFQKNRGLSLEEAAREVRYRFLGRVARDHGFSAIALGHHADDNAELVLMNLIRGSGPLGLAGIPPVRPLSAIVSDSGKARVIRPLLDLTREEILDYAAENGIPTATDRSNTDYRFLRNRIRGELIPLLRQNYNPNISSILNQTAQILRDEKEWTDRLAVREYHKETTCVPRCTPWISKSRIRKAHSAVARRLVRMAIEASKGNLRRIGFRHIDAVLALADRTGSFASLDLPDRIRVTATSDRIEFSREATPLRQLPPRPTGSQAVTFEHFLEKPGSIFIPELDITIKAEILPPAAKPDFRKAGHQEAFFDMETVPFPLTVRNPKPGDRFTPLGMSGSQKVKKFFIDHKIPAARRARTPVLESGDRLIWLMGLRTAETGKITAETKQVLKVEFDLA